MNLVTRTLELDSETDARLSEIAAERKLDVSVVLAEAIALLDSTIDVAWPDVSEDLRRRDEFLRTRMGVPWEEVDKWMASWGTANELPTPRSRRIE